MSEHKSIWCHGECEESTKKLLWSRVTSIAENKKWKRFLFEVREEKNDKS